MKSDIPLMQPEPIAKFIARFLGKRKAPYVPPKRK
jgi:hypothetical protein